MMVAANNLTPGRVVAFDRRKSANEYRIRAVFRGVYPNVRVQVVRVGTWPTESARTFTLPGDYLLQLRD